MTSWMIPAFLSTWFARLGRHVDARIRPLFPLIFAGLLFTTERRRTAASWFRAAGIGREFRRAYTVIGAVGRQTPLLATSVLLEVAAVPDACPDRLVFGLDDTPTARYGPEVEGAGLHHNPTPGPSGQPYVYGHVWVTLARLVRHPQWGTMALPVRAELYVRKKDVPCLPPERSQPFRTKLEQAVELIHWLRLWLGHLDKPLWLVADGAYAKRAVLRAAKDNAVVVVSRLRKDAALRGLPVEPPAGQRGRKPTYGREVISLAKRAGQKQGWQSATMVLYGQAVTKTYKTFLATWRPAGGVIRVVLVKEGTGWVAFFCTKPEATPAEILGVGGRPGRDRTDVQGRERGLGCGRAAVAEPARQRGGLAPELVGVHAGRAVGLGPGGAGVGGPQCVTLGRGAAAAFARGPAQGLKASVPAR
jgi:hypothetical protein